MKRQSKEQGKIFANHKSDMGPMGPEYVNNSYNSVRKTTPIKYYKKFEQTFLQKRHKLSIST